jgi:alginate O-acetyltransferase complex protein AlgI
MNITAVVFTSYTYLAFLALAFFLYWTAPPAWRKVLIIFLSYLFYCTWRWQYGFLLLGVTLFNWWYGRFVLGRREPGPLWLGIVVNVGALAYFKYLTFILENAGAAAHVLGLHWQVPHLNILLPLGISFFTFQGIAYLVDVASGEEPLHDLRDFMLFKSFWPQLIAGPIVRLDEMREQIATPRTLRYENLAEGAQRILLGFAKKTLADNIGSCIDPVFLPTALPNLPDALSGAVGFGMQIYFDFSGYSDIAIGSALLLGYRFPENFNWPYVARSPREFWSRWHMSLSRWIRDYIFMPLSFATRDKPALGPIWLLFAMALCGLWHGASWTMVAWGLWHGVLLVMNQGPLRKLFPHSEEEAAPAKAIPWWKMAFGVGITWVCVHIGWVLFRAPSFHHAMIILKSIVVMRGGIRPAILRENAVLFVVLTFCTLTALQLLRHQVTALLRMKPALGDAGMVWAHRLSFLRPVVYTMLIVGVVIFDRESQTFVYFQF